MKIVLILTLILLYNVIISSPIPQPRPNSPPTKPKSQPPGALSALVKQRSPQTSNKVAQGKLPAVRSRSGLSAATSPKKVNARKGGQKPNKMSGVKKGQKNVNRRQKKGK